MTAFLPSQHLKKLHLGGRRRGRLPSFPDEDLDAPELPVGDGHEADLALRRHLSAHPPQMHLGIVDTRAVARIDRVLPHREAILEQGLAKSRIRLPRLGRMDGQVEHRNHPHRAPPRG